MINPLEEDIVTLGPAARLFPPIRGNRPVAPNTLLRWHVRGIRGVHLEMIYVGGYRVTSKQAIQRFIQALNSNQAEATKHKQPESRRQAVEQAEAELKALGL